jgi:hypothetical protein
MEAAYTPAISAILLTSRLCKHPRVETAAAGNHCQSLKSLRVKLVYSLVGILGI